MKVKAFMLFVALVGNIAVADTLISGGQITKIGNTPDGTDGFFVRTSGGTGPCINGVVVVFPASLAANEAIYNRAYTLAITAYTTGNQNVKISSLTTGDVNCRHANYIDLSN